MLAVLAEIYPFDPGNPATRPSIFACNVDDARVCHLLGSTWWPALSKLPTLRYDLFSGDFDSNQISAPSGEMSMQIEPWPNFARYIFADARIVISVGQSDDPGSYVTRFDGRVTTQPDIKDGVATIEFAADDRWLDAALLPTYAGTTGAEGPADLKGQCKPLCLGAPRYVPGKLVDSVNNVWQLSAYGVDEVEVALERLARFGAVVSDYSSYASLIAATIPAGRWATSNLAGFARFGAPTNGQISFLVKGDEQQAGSSFWARTPGKIIKRLAQLSAQSAGVPGTVNAASLTALDTAAPYHLSLYLDTQTTAREQIQALAASVNAVAGVSWTGELFTASIKIGTPSVTLAADGSALPPVASVEQVANSAPWKSLAIGAARAWVVHPLADVAFTSTLVDMGAYASGTTYRDGNLVQDQGSSWLYINPTPAAGNAPPTLPATSNSWWKILASAGVDGTDGTDGTDGADGFTTARILLYKRSASGAPSGPTTTGTYTFSSDSITFTGGGANGWTQGIPAGTDPLYVIAASAYATTPTDAITTGEWASAVLWGQSLVSVTVTLYKRATSTPSGPTTTGTYVVATDAITFTGGGANGWTQGWPAGTDPVYVIKATALTATGSDTILTTEWPTAQIAAQNGAPGAPGSPGAGAFTIVNQVNTTVVGNVVTKTGGVNGAYDAAAHSVESFANGCTVGFTGPASGQEAIVGISQTPTASASFDVDYGIVKRTGGGWEIYEFGSSTGVTGTGANGAQFQITYTNGAVVYQKNGTIIRSVTAPAGLIFYLDMSLEITGTVVSGLSWAKAGADGIGGGASSNIFPGSGSATGSALTSGTLILPAGGKVTWETDLSFAFVANPSSNWVIQHQISVNGGGYSAFGTAGAANVSATITTADSDLINSYTNTTGSSQEIVLRAVCTHPGGGSSTWSGKGYAY